MRLRRVRRTALSWAAFIAAAGCGPEAAPSASGREPAAGQQAAPKPNAATAQPAKYDPSAPASKRLLGRYRMRLSQVPNSHLAPHLRELKLQGKADAAARLEYTFTETEVILDTYGAAGRNRASFYYEILSESGDELLVRKHGDSKGPEDMRITVEPRAIVLTAKEEESGVRLERIE